MAQLTNISQVPAELNKYVFLQQLRNAVIAIMGGVNPGVAPAPMASAPTIAPTSQITSVSGAAVIETIAATGFASGAAITLLAAPGSAWSIGAAGNVPLGLPVVTPGQIYTFVFDGTDWRTN